MELIYENERGRAQYDRERQIVIYDFFGRFNFDLSKDIINAVREYSGKHLILGAHVDLSQLEGTFSALNEYLVADYFPDVIANGMLCQSIVVPEDVFTKFAVNALIQQLGHFTIRTFSDADEAYNWVLEVVSTADAES